MTHIKRAPRTLFVDIDGTLVFHNGMMRDATNQSSLLSTDSAIQDWVAHGDTIVLTTGRKESMRDATEQQLERLGIVYDHLVMGLNSGHRVVVNDRKPWPNSVNATAYAVSKSRNSGIKPDDIDNAIESACMVAGSIHVYGKKLDDTRVEPHSLSSYTVEKPWGWEKWLDVNKHYAVKMIHMRAGNRSSLQYHRFKFETNVVIDGEAEVLLENAAGEIESHMIHSGDGWSVLPCRKHRVIAHTDYTAIETSTMHLDDVVRVEDDTGRNDGRIEVEHSA